MKYFLRMAPLVFVYLLLWPHFVVANPLILEDGQEVYPLGKHLDILEDPEGQLTFEDILSPEISEQFIPSQEEIPNFGYTNSAYWLRFQVKDVSQQKNWLLELGYSLLNQIDFYFPTASGQFQMKKGGDLLPFHDREVKNRNFLFHLPPLSEQSKHIYLRIQTTSNMVFPLTIWSIEAFLAEDHEQQAIFGFYYGMMFVMVFYNLFLFLSIRHISYLFYVLYILSFIFFQMTLNGLTYEYLWYNFPQWNDRSLTFLLGFMIFWAILFAQSFLQTVQYTPFLHKALYVPLALSVGVMFSTFVFGYAVSIKLGILLGILFAIISMTSAGLCWKRGYRPARYYLVAWFLLVSGYVAIGLKGFGILPSIFLTEYGMQIGGALEVILLSLGLADRLNTLEQEKFLAQKEISEKEKEYRELVENLNTGIYRTQDDELGSLLKANPAALHMFGYEPSELENIRISQLYAHPEDLQRVMDTLRREGACKDLEIQMKRKDGFLIWCSLSATVQFDETGKIQWIDGIVEDITKRKKSDEIIRRLNTTFEKFVPKQFLNRIADEGIDQIEVGKAQTESLSILFADIHSFTPLSETMSPQELFNFLNEYLKQVNQPIHDCYGFIDKFIGDGIMVLFDRPTHSTDSFQAAVAMIQAVKSFNENRSQQGNPPISVGIAIHTGNAIIGTVGTEDRMDSTVLGDAVNFASRMENLTKYYNAQIIISADTYEAIHDDSILCRELDFIKVKGKSVPKTIFEVFNGNDETTRKQKQKILNPYLEGLNHYKTRRWEDAIQLFGQCLKTYPDDVVSQMYLKRCHQFKEAPPHDGWQGAFNMDQK